MLNTKNLWVVTDLSESWRVAYRIVGQGGRAVVGEVRVYPREGQRFEPGSWSGEWMGARATVPPGGLTASIVHRVRLGADFFGGKKVLASRRNQSKSPFSDLLASMGITRLKRPPSPTSSVRDETKRRCAKIAAAYAAAIANGSKHPQRAAARTVGIRAEQVRDALHRARSLGLLTKTERGRAGGELTNEGRLALAKGLGRLNR